MLFGDSEKDSNTILSIASFEGLIFVTQFFQLVIDFYFGFYMVHMQQRVAVAFDSGSDDVLDAYIVQRTLIHLFTVTPFVAMMYLLMMTTRKISLLIGVLHLNDEAVSGVLEHMEMVKSIRRRIQDTLRNTKIVRGKPKPDEAQELLKKCEKGELAMLKVLADRADLREARITVAEMRAMLKEYTSLLVTQADLDTFVDRASYKAYCLGSEADKATAQTARTFEESDGDVSGDNVELIEFSSFLVRFVAEVLNTLIELTPKKGVIKKFKEKVTLLDSVDDEALEYARRLARCKSMFHATDKDSSGTVSRNELYGALRRYKVPITKDEFKHIFRVIDPDQSRSMTLYEWIDFMMATDANLELQTTEASEAEQKKNGERNNDFATLTGEGASVFFGSTVGHMVGAAVGGASDVVGGTLDVVGKGMDTVGLQSVREGVLGDDELEKRRERRKAGLPVAGDPDYIRHDVGLMGLDMQHLPPGDWCLVNRSPRAGDR